jgi:hypothetical protein
MSIAEEVPIAKENFSFNHPQSSMSTTCKLVLVVGQMLLPSPACFGISNGTTLVMVFGYNW